jgi:hypothetical protein
MKTIVYLFFILMIALGLGGCGDGGSDSVFYNNPTAVSTYSVKGNIIDANGSGLAGAAVELSGYPSASGAAGAAGALSQTTTTDANGNYTFAGIRSGDYTITPKMYGYVFVPASLSVKVSNADVDLSTDNNNKFTAKETNPTAPGFLHYVLPNQYQYEQDGLPIADEGAALFSGYTLTTGIDYDGKGTKVSGYALKQFVNKAAVNAITPDPEGLLWTIDARKLYSVVVRSNQDGFSNRSKFYDNGSKTEVYNADLIWDQFEKGYLLDLNYTGRTYFEATLTGEFMKMFNNKYAYDIYMFRKIDVKRPDAAGSLATFEVAATTDNYVDDTNFTASNSGLTTTKFSIQTLSFGPYTNVRAIPLTQFLTDYVTNAPASYTYKIVALDDTKSQTGWTYAAMQQAYYLPDYDFIIQVNAGSVVEGTKVNFPVRIELISGAAVEYDFSAKNPPAYAKAYNE